MQRDQMEPDEPDGSPGPADQQGQANQRTTVSTKGDLLNYSAGDLENESKLVFVQLDSVDPKKVRVSLQICTACLHGFLVLLSLLLLFECSLQHKHLSGGRCGKAWQCMTLQCSKAEALGMVPAMCDRTCKA